MSASPDEALGDLIDRRLYPIEEAAFQARCRRTLSADGVLVLPRFLEDEALQKVRREAVENAHRAYFCVQDHNVYLSEPDPAYPPTHPRNRTVVSSKGCITDDVVPAGSPLRALYDSRMFRQFLAAVLDEQTLHAYADPLSSINVHYASEGQELGWHFDNSSFAITLLIQAPETGGRFEYVTKVRDADRGEMNFEAVARVLDGVTRARVLPINPGALVLFRGRNAMHRVTPALGKRQRILVVLAYNSEPGISLSRSARMTFYGRLG